MEARKGGSGGRGRRIIFLKKGIEALLEAGPFAGIGKGGDFFPEEAAGRFGNLMNIRIQGQEADTGEKGAVGIADLKVGAGPQEEGFRGLDGGKGGGLEEGIEDGEGPVGKPFLNLPV